MLTEFTPLLHISQLSHAVHNHVNRGNRNTWPAIGLSNMELQQTSASAAVRSYVIAYHHGSVELGTSASHDRIRAHGEPGVSAGTSGLRRQRDSWCAAHTPSNTETAFSANLRS